VTRTASEEPDTPLGQELSRQLFGLPKALQVAAIFLLLLAVVPGLPAAPFAILAIVFLLVARVRSRALARDQHRATSEPAPQPGAAARGQIQFVPRVVPWGLDVGADLAPLVDDAPGRTGIRALLMALRELIFAELGVPIPPPRIRVEADVPLRHV